MSFYKRRRPKQEEEKCADPAKARARALDALASREMSSAQLYERLCYGFTEQAAAAAVAEMVELDYVNDDRYAEARAHSLLCRPQEPPCGGPEPAAEGPFRRADRAGAGKRLCPGRRRRKPGAGSCRRSGAQPLHEKAGRWPLRPCGWPPCMRRGFAYSVIKEAIKRAEEE